MYAQDVPYPRGLGWFAMARRAGPPGPFRVLFGPGPYGFPRGPRARRGDVRAAILALLAEGPRNGYQLMQEIEERSDGAWRPSPGSVYPALQQLEDEGLVRAEERDGRRTYALTDAGRAHVDERGDELKAPWDAVRAELGAVPKRELMGLIQQVAMPLYQIAHTGSEAQAEEARRVLGDARRSLYRILAEGDPAEPAS
jgi:DNA-binding PadR family transcriptional regulator